VLFNGVLGWVSKIYYAAAWTDYSDLFDDSNISMDMKIPYAERAFQLSARDVVSDPGSPEPARL
jgi:hypothetical protein